MKPSAKCWFYFSIEGNYTYLPVKLHLLKTNSLNMVVTVPSCRRKSSICIGQLFGLKEVTGIGINLLFSLRLVLKMT